MSGHLKINKVFNGWAVTIQDSRGSFKYIVWQYSQAIVIENIYETKGQTPTDIINDAIELLKENGCMTLGWLRKELGIRPAEWTVCKQCDPLASNVIKMSTGPEPQVKIWLRGPSVDGHGRTTSRPVGTKNNAISPLWNEPVARQVVTYDSTEWDHYPDKLNMNTENSKDTGRMVEHIGPEDLGFTYEEAAWSDEIPGYSSPFEDEESNICKRFNELFQEYQKIMPLEPAARAACVYIITQKRLENKTESDLMGVKCGFAENLKEKSEFHSIVEEILELHEKKDNDYAGGEELSNFKEALRINIPAWKGAFIRLQDKYIRCCNLISGVERKVDDESFEDTLQDLGSYSIIVLALYRKWKRGELPGPGGECYGEEEN